MVVEIYPMGYSGGMRITVDTANCDGAGGCQLVCPQVFVIDDDDLVMVLDEHPEPSLHDRVRTAAKICPHDVITVHERD
jgi:ferredoxin